MKKALLLLAIVGCSIPALAQPSAWSWGTTGHNSAHGVDACFQPGGNMVVAGTFANTIQIGSQVITRSGYNGFLSAYDATGNLLFLEEACTGSGILSVAADAAGNIYTCGAIQSSWFGTQLLQSRGNGDIYVACYTPQGDFRWVQQIGGPGPEEYYVNGIACVPGQTGVVVNAMAWDSCLIGGQMIAGTGYQSLTARFDESGNLMWHQSGGGTGMWNNAAGFGVSADAGGNVYGSGSINGTVAIGGLSIPDAGPYRPYVAKYRADGSVAWVTACTGTGAGSALSYRTAVDRHGNVYVTGFPGWSYQGGLYFGNTPLPKCNYFIAKLDTNGSWQWLKWGNGPAFSNTTLAIDDNDDVYMGGILGDSLTIDGETLLRRDPFAANGYVVKFRPNGTVQAAVKTGNPGSRTEVTAIAVTPGRDVFVAGGVADTVRFGTSTVIGRPSAVLYESFFLAKAANRLKASGESAGSPGRLHVYPIPADKMLTVEAGTAASGRILHLRDLRGALLLSRVVPAGGYLSLEIKDLPNGLYTASIDGISAILISVQHP